MSSDSVVKTTVAESLREKLTAKQTELGSRLSGKYIHVWMTIHCCFTYVTLQTAWFMFLKNVICLILLCVFYIPVNFLVSHLIPESFEWVFFNLILSLCVSVVTVFRLCLLQFCVSELWLIFFCHDLVTPLTSHYAEECSEIYNTFTMNEMA